ncbi:MAG: hypothetical protein ACFFBH_16185 [Promethearchaeota archaeon]
MKRKSQLSLIVSILFLVITGLLISPANAQAFKYEAHEEKFYGEWDPIYGQEVQYEIRLDLQGDIVYEEGSGYTEFAMWLYGVNLDVWDYTFSRRILIKMYATAYYKNVYIIPRRPTQYYWGPIPNGLIQWTGDWDIHLDVSGTQWQWITNGQTKYSDGSDNTAAQGSKSHSSGNAIDGIYRYLGWAKVQKKTWFVYFDGLLKFHIDNTLANNWDNGIYHEEGSTFWVESITKLQFKFIVYFQYEWFGWRSSKVFTIILGDGSPSSDLSAISLVPGQIIGLVNV